MLTPEQRALLNVIASTEAPDYNVLYGGSRFTDYSRHPAIYKTIRSGPNKGKKTSAAGRYQFLKSTWDRVARGAGLTDFGPASQDVGALWLASSDYKRRTGRSLHADLLNPARLPAIGAALAPTWTSLPGGIEQGQGSNTFVRRFNAELGKPGATRTAATAGRTGRGSQTPNVDDLILGSAIARVRAGEGNPAIGAARGARGLDFASLPPELGRFLKRWGVGDAPTISPRDNASRGISGMLLTRALGVKPSSGLGRFLGGIGSGGGVPSSSARAMSPEELQALAPLQPAGKRARARMPDALEELERLQRQTSVWV